MIDREQVEAQAAGALRATWTWWSRRPRPQRWLMLGGLVGFAAIVSPGVRGVLVGLVAAALGIMLLVALLAATVVGLLWRVVRRHPLADLAVGYLIGRLRGRRRLEQYQPGRPSHYYPPPSRDESSPHG
jgi:hypothetical protein